MAPLCKGGWQIADIRQFVWGIALRIHLQLMGVL